MPRFTFRSISFNGLQLFSSLMSCGSVIVCLWENSYGRNANSFFLHIVDAVVLSVVGVVSLASARVSSSPCATCICTTTIHLICMFHDSHNQPSTHPILWNEFMLSLSLSLILTAENNKHWTHLASVSVCGEQYQKVMYTTCAFYNGQAFE